jgi:hypothetical protein
MDYAGRLKRGNGQATLEFTLMFVIMVALLFSLLGMWKWSVSSMVNRQKAYNATRLSAGSDNPGVLYPYSVPRLMDDKDVKYLK